MFIMNGRSRISRAKSLGILTFLRCALCSFLAYFFSCLLRLHHHFFFFQSGSPPLFVLSSLPRNIFGLPAVTHPPLSLTAQLLLDGGTARVGRDSLTTSNTPTLSQDGFLLTTLQYILVILVLSLFLKFLPQSWRPFPLPVMILILPQGLDQAVVTGSFPPTGQ